MSLGWFDQTNLKSKQVRFLVWLLLFMAVVYALGFATYHTRQIPAGSMAPEMLRNSVIFFTLAAMLVLFLLMLRWQVLRTAILALSLLSLAFLYCALVLVLFENRLVHAIGLLVLGALFMVVFLTQSNLRIYIRDKTYADASLEGLMGLGFMGVITLMIMRALGMH